MVQLKEVVAAHKGSDNFNIEIDSSISFGEVVFESLLASYKENPERIFIVVCNKADSDKVFEYLEPTNLIERANKREGNIWLTGSKHDRIPTVMFRRCQRGREEALAGWRLRNARAFIDADYISGKGFIVITGSMIEPDNAVTAIYRKKEMRVAVMGGNYFSVEFQ